MTFRYINTPLGSGERHYTGILLKWGALDDVSEGGKEILDFLRYA